MSHVHQYQRRNSHILNDYEDCFAVSAEREAVADIVAKSDQEGSCLEPVAEERETFSRLRFNKFDELRHFDDRGCCDDGDAKGFGDGEREAVRLGEDVEVEEEGGVADLAEEGYREVGDWLRQVVSERCEERFEGINYGVLEGIHGSGVSAVEG